VVTPAVVEVVKDPVVEIRGVVVKARVVEAGLAAAGEDRVAVEEAVDRAAAVSRVVAAIGRY